MYLAVVLARQPCLCNMMGACSTLQAPVSTAACHARQHFPCSTCVNVILALPLQHSSDSSQWLMPGILIEPKAHVKAGDFDRIVVLQVGLLISSTAGCLECMSRRLPLLEAFRTLPVATRWLCLYSI